jgi:thiamine-monophosphate kinase
MCDISDGLLADLGHVCEVSGVAAVVSLGALPFSEAAQLVAAGDPKLPSQLATGGDDYELIFTAPLEHANAIRKLAEDLDLPITEIGVIEPGTGVRLIDAEGREVAVASAGYRHF